MRILYKQGAMKDVSSPVTSDKIYGSFVQDQVLDIALPTMQLSTSNAVHFALENEKLNHLKEKIPKLDNEEQELLQVIKEKNISLEKQNATIAHLTKEKDELVAHIMKVEQNTADVRRVL